MRKKSRTPHAVLDSEKRNGQNTYLLSIILVYNSFYLFDWSQGLGLGLVRSPGLREGPVPGSHLG